jgi:hypothetical protein
MDKQIIKTNFAFLCDYAFFAAPNKPSVIGIFKKLHLQKVPGTITQFTFVAELNVHHPQTYKPKLTVYRPDGTINTEHELPDIHMNDSGGKDIGIMFQFSNYELPEIGTYTIKLELNNILSSAVTFEVSASN